MAKKIHDIKKRPKRLAGEETKRSFGHHDFWGGVIPLKHHKTKSKKDHSKTAKRILIASFVVCVVGLIYGQAVLTRTRLSISLSNSQTYLQSSIEAIDKGDWQKAISESNKASSEIIKIQKKLQAFGQDSQMLQLIALHSRFVTAQILLETTAQLLDTVKQGKDVIAGSVGLFNGMNLEHNKDLNISVPSQQIDDYLSKSRQTIAEVNIKISKINNRDLAGLAVNRQQILSLLSGLDQKLALMQRDGIAALNWLVPKNGKRNILVLFQNNSELRGSGGFLGSYAVLRTENGQIKKIDFQTNIYKLDTSFLQKTKIAAPQEFANLANGMWSLRDSNYAADGPESFTKVLEFYQLESGEALDGVIALDTTLVNDLLALAGPIEMPAYGLTISDQNFLKDVEYQVERGYFLSPNGKTENEPKKILADMMPLLFAKITNAAKKGQGMELIKLLEKEISSKHLIFYSTDSNIHAYLSKQNWSAEIKSGNYDYLLSHSTNIGGGKSSLNVTEEVDDTISITPDGFVNHAVTIKRSHSGDGNWPDAANINLMRMFLPVGSKINNFSAVSGNFWPQMQKSHAINPVYYTGSEAGKDKISFWMNTAPKSSSEATFHIASSYQIDLKRDDPEYILLIQKEAGTMPAHYQLTVNLPPNLEFINSSSQKPIHSVNLNFDLNKDKKIVLNLHKK